MNQQEICTWISLCANNNRGCRLHLKVGASIEVEARGLLVDNRDQIIGYTSSSAIVEVRLDQVQEVVPFFTDPRICLCGSKGWSTGCNQDGYPTYRCYRCGATWWATTCWRDPNHAVDNRFSSQCSNCGWWHCPACHCCCPPEDPSYPCSCQGE